MTNKIKHFGRFIVRRPLLSPRHFFKKGEVGIDGLIDLYLKDANFMESLYINSREIDFVQLLAKANDDKKHEKAKQTLLRYINRCSFQSAPFGLNALIGIGRIGDKTNGRVSGNGEIKRKIRLDTVFLYSICRDLLKEGFVRSNIKLFPNNSIYKIGEKYRYAEFKLKGDNRAYTLSTFDHSDFMEAVLSFCKSGRKKGEIVGFMLGLDKELAPEECDSFLDELWESKILVDDFEPLIVGKDYGVQIIEVLECMDAGACPDGKTKATLKALRRFYAFRDAFLEKQTVSKQDYIDLISPLRDLYPDVNCRNFIQVDGMTDEDHLSLSPCLVEEIKKGMATLTKFSDKILNGRLASFKNEFYERYEHEAKRLVEVLDPDLGIGYPANMEYGIDDQSIVDSIPPPAIGFGNRYANLPWKPKMDALLVEKTIEAIKAGSSVITFSDKELENIPSKVDALPPTFAVSASLIDRDDRKWIHFNEIGASSATSTIGRFTLDNPDIRSLAEEISAFEQMLCPNQRLSEINHLTDPVIGNITLRSKLRKHEIPYITKSNTKETDNVIAINDIYVQIVDEEIVLLNQDGIEIVPRLSNAHNYNLNALSVYKFLADLQDAQSGYVQFQVDTVVLRKIFSFVPRIVHKNCIFHPATWILGSKEMLGHVKLALKDEEDNSLKVYLGKKGIPSKFFVKTAHNALFVDTAHSSSLFLMERELARSAHVEISECLYEDFDEFFLNDGALERFSHEFIIPFGNEGFTLKAKSIRPVTMDRGVKKRKFFPGEEWTYLKIYGSDPCLQQITRQYLMKIMKSIKSNDGKSQWFFLRYADPKPHLRIRIKSEVMNTDDVLNVFRSNLGDLMDTDRIWKIMIDTYQREVERYDPKYIDMCEAIFEVDSWFVLNYRAQKGHVSEKERIFAALSLFGLYFNVFGWDLEDQHAFLKEGRDMFSIEFGANKAHRLFFSKYFRLMEDEMDLFTYNFNGDRQLQSLFKEYAAQLERAVENVPLGGGIEQTLRSIIHMNILRLFPSNNRKHEYFVYSLLEHRLRKAIGRKMFIR